MFGFPCSCVCFDSLGVLFESKQNPAPSSGSQVDASLNRPHVNHPKMQESDKKNSVCLPPATPSSLGASHFLETDVFCFPFVWEPQLLKLTENPAVGGFWTWPKGCIWSWPGPACSFPRALRGPPAQVWDHLPAGLGHVCSAGWRAGLRRVECSRSAVGRLISPPRLLSA